MKQLLTSVAIILLFASCDDGPFINHKLQTQKIGECTNEVTPIKMEGNINGERYEFNYCVDEDFDGKNYTIERSGDSLIVKFAKPTKKTALYKMILDVDAKPAYHHIKLGDQTLEIVPTDKF